MSASLLLFLIVRMWELKKKKRTLIYHFFPFAEFISFFLFFVARKSFSKQLKLAWQVGLVESMLMEITDKNKKKR